MERSDLLRHLARVIEEVGLRYFVTGSTATMLYSEPRPSNDIDVVVDLSEPQVHGFCLRFPEPEFRVSEAAACEAVRQRTFFNIHPATGVKVDVLVPKLTPFNQSRFSRVRRVRAGDDFEVNVASPEDAILKKLAYYREGGLEKHVRDITGIFKYSRAELDMAYIDHWARQMGLEHVWAATQRRIGLG